MKVKNAALELIGEMHSQLGPVVKALLVSSQETDQSVKDQIEKKINSSPLDPGASSCVREKTCLVAGNSEGDEGMGSDSANGVGFEIPKTDIVASLPSDCITRMVSRYKVKQRICTSLQLTTARIHRNVLTGFEGK